MAEYVQENLEGMRRELDQLKRLKLLSDEEVNSVLVKRRRYENKLQMGKQKTYFTDYAQYEMNLLNLLHKRRKRKGIAYKLFVDSELNVSTRIHKLLRGACMRYQSDVKLWLTHVEFAKRRNEKKTAGKILTRMLQVHNKRPEIWIEAANLEVDSSSPDTARQLLLRGLRFNDSSELLWREYLRFELNVEVNRLAESSKKKSQARLPRVVYNRALATISDDGFRESLDKLVSEYPFSKVILESGGDVSSSDDSEAEDAPATEPKPSGFIELSTGEPLL